MILVDANLLIYAVNADLTDHLRSKAWLEAQLSGTDLVGLPWVTVLAFLRVCTNGRVFNNPLSVDSALSYVDEWFALPSVRAVAPGPHHWKVLRELLTTTGTGGNLTTDVHIAAMAMEHGCAVYSADNDFKRFAGVRHVNPLMS